MAAARDLSLSFTEVRASRQSLADSTIAYRGSAMGVVAANGRVRPLVSGDDFAGFLTAQSDNRAFATGAAALSVQLVAQGLVQLSVTGVVATSLGDTVYATDDNTFTLTIGGSTVGTVQQYVSAGVAIVSFDAFAAVSSSSGSSGSSGAASGGSSDLTAQTISGTGSSAIRTGYTAGGLAWAITRDGSGVPTSEANAAPDAGTLSITYTYSEGYPVVSGNIVVGGAVSMTWAQAKTLAAHLTAAGSSAYGFRALVSDIGGVTNTAGAVTAMGAELTWGPFGWRAVHGVHYHNWNEQTHAAASTSAVLNPLVVPSQLLGVYGWIEGWAIVDHGTTTNGTRSVNVRLNGASNIVDTAGNATTAQSSVVLRFVLRNEGIATAQIGVNSAGAVTGGTVSGSGVSDNIPFTAAINTGTTDLTIGPQITQASALDTSTLKGWGLSVYHP